MLEIINVPSDEITVPEMAILTRLGFRKTKEMPSDFRELYECSLTLVRDTAEPLALIKNLSCNWDTLTNSLQVLSKTLKGRLIEKHLKECERLSLLLVSLGKGVDRLIGEKHENNEELFSFFLDAISSEFAEYTARRIDVMLRERTQGYISTARISPGYGDLPLEWNSWFVEVLHGEEYGISCRKDSYILLPRKTISAFIGWRKPL